MRQADVTGCQNGIAGERVKKPEWKICVNARFYCNTVWSTTNRFVVVIFFMIYDKKMAIIRVWTVCFNISYSCVGLSSHMSWEQNTCSMT